MLIYHMLEMLWTDQVINQPATDSINNGMKIETKALTEKKLDKSVLTLFSSKTLRHFVHKN
jgi:hypothetical protein